MSGYITFEERLEIESMIFQRCSFGEIAKKINKDRSTISREIRGHSITEKKRLQWFVFWCIFLNFIFFTVLTINLRFTFDVLNIF